MKIKWNRLNRKTHYWGAIICAEPVLIVIITSIMPLLKKGPLGSCLQLSKLNERLVADSHLIQFTNKAPQQKVYCEAIFA